MENKPSSARQRLRLLARIQELEKQNSELLKACISMNDFIILNGWSTPTDIKKLIEYQIITTGISEKI